MAAPDIDNLLTVESGRIGEDIYARTMHRSIWLDMVEKGTWPDGMGQTISVLVYENSVPASPTAWSTVSFNSGSGNSCVPEADQIEFAQTLRTYNLAQKALEGPKICVNDLRFTFQAQKQLENCFSILANNTHELLANRHRDEYVRLAGHKVICTDGYPEASASFPLTEPTSRLTSGALKRVYLRLNRDGAHRDGGAVAMEDGAPVYVAIMSPETDEAIIEQDYQIREDFRNTDRAPELLRALGIKRSYKGFYHVIDHEAPRYDFSGGAWVRRSYYDLESTTKGDRAVLNADYESAEFEDTIIFLPSVYKTLVPAPISNPGGNTEFEPQTYMGDWKWLNIQDRIDNPDRSWGNFRGLFANGSEPIHPEFGWVIRHLRPNIAQVFVDADGNTVEAA
jgi:hypothetical protein